ncbi:hypothetical protein F5877DRAFT_84503 [Lentinula edodes]|nr:hypothetical protein F5877DRAFT_84503 [Lentinula edodes]
MFLHLFGLCMISSTVLNVVASPIFHEGALHVSRADNYHGSTAQASSTVSHPVQYDKWEHDKDGMMFWDGDPVEDSPEVLEVLGKPNNEVKDLAIAIYRSRGRNTPDSQKKYWLCVGSRCLRANKDPKAPSNLLSDVIIGRGTLQQLKDLGKISFTDLDHKRDVFINFGKGQRHFFEGKSDPSNWDYLAAVLRQLRRKSKSAGAQFTNQEEFEQYMQEEAKKNLFG